MENYKYFTFSSFSPCIFPYTNDVLRYADPISSNQEFTIVDWNYRTLFRFINDGHSFHHNLKIDKSQDIGIDLFHDDNMYRLIAYSDKNRYAYYLIISSDFDVIFNFLVNIVMVQ